MWYIVLQTKATKSRGINGRHRGEVWTTHVTGGRVHAAAVLGQLMTSDGGECEVLRRERSYRKVRRLMETFHNRCSREFPEGPEGGGRKYNDRVVRLARIHFHAGGGPPTP